MIDYQDRLAHSGPIFKTLNILKVKDIAKQQLITVMHKKFTRVLPIELDALFTLSNAPNNSNKNQTTFQWSFFGTVTWHQSRNMGWSSALEFHYHTSYVNNRLENHIQRMYKNVCQKESSPRIQLTQHIQVNT